MRTRLLVIAFTLWIASIAVAVVLAHGAVFLPPAFRPIAEPRVAEHVAGPDHRWTAVEIPSFDGARLKAWYFPGARRDAVILLHGVADSRRGMSGHARMLLTDGYSVLAPDSRGHGESGGEPFSYGVRERQDVARWVDWLARQQHATRIFGLGASMGAAILLQTLPVEPRILAAVAECPFATFREVAYHRIAQASGMPPWLGHVLAAPVTEQAFLYTNVRFGINLNHSSPRDALRQTKAPVLFIHGAEDTNIPPSHSEDLARLSKSEVWIVPRAHHVQSLSVAGAEYRRRVLAHFAAASP